MNENYRSFITKLLPSQIKMIKLKVKKQCVKSLVTDHVDKIPK